MNEEHEDLCVALSEVRLEGIFSYSEAGEGITTFMMLVLGVVVVFFILEVCKMTWMILDERCELSEEDDSELKVSEEDSRWNVS